MTTYPLYECLKQQISKKQTQAADLLDAFLQYASDKGLSLYPAQEEAILQIFDHNNVILNTPTGSGKSLVALAMHFLSIAQRKKSIYTCPIKALVNEKFLALCHEFGPEQVGMITGDASVNPDAPIVCCTAEILANAALREGANLEYADIIIDEFHYYSDRDRGVAWQIPLLTLENSRFLLMSATMGDTEFFQQKLSALTNKPSQLVKSDDRPVPLDFTYKDTPLEHTVEELLSAGKAPIYIVNFTQRECALNAQNFLSINFCSKEEKKEISNELKTVQFSSPYGKEIKKLLQHGIGIHHAGLLPKYRVLVESLAQKGMLKIICGTDTLGVGVNVPIRTVLFTKLCKFDGEKTGLLSVRDFHQISGRAGRKGFDARGSVVAQAPAHVIENLKQERKAALNPRSKKKLVKMKPPERGYVHWNEETFTKLQSSPPEKLSSRFQISHAMLLNVLSRQSDGCMAMKELLRNSHESDKSKERHRARAFQLFRSLLDRKIIEIIPPEDRLHTKIRVNVDLQDDFSLNQTLSLYLIDTLSLIDPMSEDYACNLLSLVESILENPTLILRRQLDRIKTEKMQEMKAEGLEYDERMEELEKLEYPKPNKEFIYRTFNEFSEKHPWVGQENIRPKSIAREMFETYQSFAEYIKGYGLERVEGLLLRYLSDVYKVLIQTVPFDLKNDEIDDMTAFFETMIKTVDSSLVDEWEKIKNPTWTTQQLEDDIQNDILDITKNERAFIVLIRNAVFQLVRALSKQRYKDAIDLIHISENHPWTSESLRQKVNLYLEDHQNISVTPKARNTEFVRIKKHDTESKMLIEQTLIDPENKNDWILHISVDFALAREAGKPLLELTDLKPAEDL